MPAHLRYSPSRWNDDHHIAIRIMLLASYFQYLYSIFLIQRLLVPHDPSAETALLDVSSEILSTVLLSGRQQEPNINVQRDFNTTVGLQPQSTRRNPSPPTNIHPRSYYTASPAPAPSSKPFKPKFEPASPSPTPAQELNSSAISACSSRN
jgi:hypothetical protein